MKKWFAIHGCPKELHSDNGPQYSSALFKRFSKSWNFEHVTSSPHHPRSNGLAERFVQTAKNLLKKCKEDNTDIQLALLMARSTPAENLPSAAERLFKRKTRTPISFVEKQPVDLKNEKITAQIERNRNRQKHYADQHSKRQPEFEPRENVLLQEGPKKWFSAEVIERHTAPRSYIVKSEDGQVYRRNSKHIRKSTAKVHKPPTSAGIPTGQHMPRPDTNSTQTNFDESVGRDDKETSNNITQRDQSNTLTTRSGRIVKPVVRLDL
jgi:hypothetical protein